MQIKDWVLAARTSKGWNQTQLGEAVGRTKGAIGHWETGRYTPSFEQINHISIATGYPAPSVGSSGQPSDTSGHDVVNTAGGIQPTTNVAAAPALRASTGVPVVGEVRGGPEGYLDELQYPVGHGEGFVEYWARDAAAYALRVRGDSMHPRYRAGEYVVVTPTVEASPGNDVVVACVDGRKLLKQLNWERDGDVQLLSINGDYTPLTLSLSEILTIHRVAGSVGRDAFYKS